MQEYLNFKWILNLDVQTGSDQILTTGSRSDNIFKTGSGFDLISKIGSVSDQNPRIRIRNPAFKDGWITGRSKRGKEKNPVFRLHH